MKSNLKVWHALTFSALFVLLPTSVAQAFHHGPYLTDARQNAMTISWVTNEPSTSVVSYAPQILAFDPNVIVDPGDHVDDGYDPEQWQEHYLDGDDFLIRIPVIHAW